MSRFFVNFLLLCGVEATFLHVCHTYQVQHNESHGFLKIEIRRIKILLAKAASEFNFCKFFVEIIKETKRSHYLFIAKGWCLLKKNELNLNDKINWLHCCCVQVYEEVDKSPLFICCMLNTEITAYDFRCN